MVIVGLIDSLSMFSPVEAEGFAVHVGVSVMSDGCQMLRRAVALVSCKAICGELCVRFDHHTIARHLRNDRCRGDCGLQTVTADDGTVWKIKPKFVTTIDEQIRRCLLFREHGDGLLHCMLRRFQYSNAIDDGGIG